MQIQLINESEFNKLEGVRQVIVHDYSHKFALVNLGETLGCYGLSWRSQLVEPIVEFSTQNIVWIGIDQQLAAICLQNGRIRLALPLTSNIIQILTLDTVTAVLTEEEVLLFNPGGSIRYTKALKDTAMELLVVGDNLVIQLLEGESLTLNPETGTFTESAVAASA